MILELFRLAGVSPSTPNACGTQTGLWPSLYSGLECTSGDVRINSISDILQIIANITQIALVASGGLAIVFLLVAAVYYIVSAGDPGRTKRAKEIIQYTIVGIVVIIISYAVVRLIALGL